MLQSKNKICLSLVLASFIVTAFTFWLAIAMHRNYLAHAAYFFDPVYYSSYNVELAARVAEEGRLAVAWDEIVNNARHPYRTVPLVLLAPSLLGQRFGHMATLLPAFWLFTFLFGWTVYHRTKRLGYTLAAMGLLMVLPIFYHLTRSLAAYWLEWPATFFAGSAALALINAVRTKRDCWIVLFAVCASLTALSRYVGVVFVGTMCLPLWLRYLYGQWREQRTWRAVLRPIGLTLGVVGVMMGYFLVAHAQSILFFYSTYGYALNQTFQVSWQFIWSSWVEFLSLGGWAQYFYLLALAGVGLVALLHSKVREQWRDFCFMAWLPLATPLTLIAMRTNYAAHPIVYGLPLLVLFAVTPMPWTEPGQQSKGMMWLRRLCVMIMVLFVAALSFRYYQVAQNLAVRDDSTEKIFNLRLARNLATVPGEHLVWQGYFDEYATIPTMELYYSTRTFMLPAPQSYYYNHVSGWEGDFPGLTPQQVAERVYAANKQWVDVVVVLGDTQQVLSNSWMQNEYSRAVALYMTEQVQTDPQWQKVFDLNDDTYYGRVVGYINTAPRSDNYEAVLKHDPLTKP